MEHMSVLPMSDHSGIGSGALGAFAGALFGSWFGDGFGGYNRHGVAPVVAPAVDTTAILQGQAAINSNVTRAATDAYIGLNTAIQSGTMANVQGFNQVNSTLCQGFGGVNTAIREEGCATRELIQNNLITQLQTELCDVKASKASLEAQLNFQASQAAQTNAILTAIANIPSA